VPAAPLGHCRGTFSAALVGQEFGQKVNLDSRAGPPLGWGSVVELVPRVHRGDLRRRVVAAALLAAPFCLAGSALPALVWWRAPAATADQISTTRQQIATLETTAVAGARRIHGLTVAYNQASFQASALTHELSEAQAEVQALQAQTTKVSSQLRQQAIYSYTGTYTGVPNLDPGQGPDLAVRAEYVSIASGDLKDSIDRYRTSRRQLAGAQAQLVGQQRESAAALAAVSQARQEAIVEATADQAHLDSLQGELTTLVAAEQAQAQARSAAAAVQAKPTSQGLPVNGGLVAVVRATVAPVPAPAPPASTPPSTLPPATVPPAPAVVTAPAPAPAPAAGDGGAGGVWFQLRECESGDYYQANTGNGYFGAYQFSQQTWTNLGYPGRPDLEPPAMQDAAAQKLQAESGWGQWPACSAALGLS
jgi:transglycosylase-like protein